MMAPEVRRSAQQTATDARALTALDWRQVWLGPAGHDLRQWCAQFGWELISTAPGRAGLVVRLRDGAELDVTTSSDRSDAGKPAHIVGTLWRVRAERAQENPGLLAEANRAWPEYIAAVTGVLNAEPTAAKWSDEPFPASPLWADADVRRREQTPRRVAVWPGDGDRPTTELWINLAHGTIAGTTPGSVSIRLGIRPAALAATPR